MRPSPEPAAGSSDTAWAGDRRLSGVGIGLRFTLWPALKESVRRLDWLELIPENYVEQGGWRRAQLEQARARWPLVAHGVSASVGGPDPLDERYLLRLKALLDSIGAEFYSDHLCWTGARGHHYHDLLPLPFSEEAIDWTAARARKIAEILERPLLLENVTYYATMPGSVLDEGAFITEVLRRSGTYLLLDVNNAYQNAINHGQDPLRVLEALPLSRTRQIHLAGHEPDQEGVLLDRHGTPVADQVWTLYAQAIERIGHVPTLIEWDNDIPALDRVLCEADHARDVMAEALGRRAQKAVKRAG